MIHIEGDEIQLDDEMDEDEFVHDLKFDKQMKGFLDELKKVGPFSKQILSYSYPPLLYQRGDEEDDDDADDKHEDGLPDFAADLDDDEDKDIQELIRGGGGK